LWIKRITLPQSFNHSKVHGKQSQKYSGKSSPGGTHLERFLEMTALSSCSKKKALIAEDLQRSRNFVAYLAGFGPHRLLTACCSTGNTNIWKSA
jgi:hypothetical protein